MPTYTIGSYSFVSMSGEIPHPRQRVERLVRSGVDYQSYRIIGYGSEPFEITTRVNVASIQDGRNTLTGYSALVGAGPQTFIYADYDLPTQETISVHVLDVETVRLRAVNVWCGSLDDTDTFELVARWRLELKE